MGEVIYGVDFRRHRDKPVSLTELANEVINSITMDTELANEVINSITMDAAFFNASLHDTLPCEYIAPMDDPA